MNERGRVLAGTCGVVAHLVCPLYLTAWFLIAFVPALIWSRLRFRRFLKLEYRIITRTHAFPFRCAWRFVLRSIACTAKAISFTWF